MLRIHRGVLSESTYRDEDPERATQPEAVSVVRRRTVPWTYCRNTNARDITKRRHLSSQTQIVPERMRFHSSSRDGAVGYFPRKGASIYPASRRLSSHSPPNSRITALARTPENEGDNVCRCIGIPILHSIDRLGRDSNLRSIDHRETRTQALTDHGYENIDSN